MKKLMLKSVLLLFLLVSPVVTNAASKESDDKVANYRIESVFCSGCVAGIQSIVGEIEGVVSVEVNVQEHRLTVVFEEDSIDVETLQGRITGETTFELKLLSVGIPEKDAS